MNGEYKNIRTYSNAKKILISTVGSLKFCSSRYIILKLRDLKSDLEFFLISYFFLADKMLDFIVLLIDIYFKI